MWFLNEMQALSNVICSFILDQLDRCHVDNFVFVTWEVLSTTVDSRQETEGIQMECTKLFIEMHYGKRLIPMNTQIQADFELLNLPFRTARLQSLSELQTPL
jgi:hypothetical protein